MKELIIIGASGHGKVVADIARKNGYDKIRFLDDRKELAECDGYPVIGTSKDALKFDCDLIVAIGNAKVRERIQQMLENNGKHVPVFVHPSAIIGGNVRIGAGSVVAAGAVINPSTVIGRGCIINTCSSVDHDCRIDDYVHISVGAHLAGTVTVGERTWIGIGAVVNNNLKITGDCMIGAGAVIIENISETGTYVGVPARRIK